MLFLCYTPKVTVFSYQICPTKFTTGRIIQQLLQYNILYKEIENIYIKILLKQKEIHLSIYILHKTRHEGYKRQYIKLNTFV